MHIYVTDHQHNLNIKCYQYMQTTQQSTTQAKISGLNNCRNTISESINKLSAWSKVTTLAFNQDYDAIHSANIQST